MLIKFLDINLREVLIREGACFGNVLILANRGST